MLAVGGGGVGRWGVGGCREEVVGGQRDGGEKVVVCGF